jgi:uncharacterized membrane protein YhhN
MRKKWPIILFLIVLVLTLASIGLNNNILHYITKPLIVPSLILLFLSETKSFPIRLRTWVLFALIFSWIGDCLLMFETHGEIFFMTGLASFLIAHIFYILFFHGLRVREHIPAKPWVLLPVAIYYGALMFLLSPLPSAMNIPVKIYGVVICFMLVLAIHAAYSRNRKAATMLLTGAAFFVISDSMLAIDKFLQAFSGSGIMIMLTYGIAQLCLVLGSIGYIRHTSNLSRHSG